MSLSPQALVYEKFLEEVLGRASTPGLELPVVRAVVESLHLASTEPPDVTYTEVDANGVPALWCVPKGASPDHALLHFHFGGSVMASMHSDRKSAGHIASAAGMPSLVVDFRRAPEHPYPAQFDDSEAAFNWLVSQGFAPNRIGSTGHSIGGTLAAALPLRLLAKGQPAPGAVLSISPWYDLTMTDPAIEANAGTDKMLTRELLEMFRGALLGAPGIAFDDPAVSLKFADISGLPPTYLSWGTYELLAGEDEKFGERLLTLGNGSVVRPMVGGQHSFILGAGRVPEVDEFISDMGAWLRAALVH